MNTDLIKFIKSRYDPKCNVAGSIHGNMVKVSSTDIYLLEIIEKQQAEIDTLKTQVARLMDAVPQAGPPKNDGSNRGRHKLFKT